MTNPDAQAGAVLARARAVHPALPDRAPDEESRERMTELLEHARTAAAAAAGSRDGSGLPERGPSAGPQAKDAGNPAGAEREPGCDDGDEEPPHPEVEEQEQPSGDVNCGNAQVGNPAPLHTPHVCKSCSAPIFWAAILDERGQRVKGDSGRWRAMPVNAQPDPAGNVVLLHRPGEGIVARVLRRGQCPAPGAVLRTSHFATCPNADRHRRRA